MQQHSFFGPIFSLHFFFFFVFWCTIDIGTSCGAVVVVPIVPVSALEHTSSEHSARLFAGLVSSWTNSNHSSSDELWWLWSRCRDAALFELDFSTGRAVLVISDMALVRKNPSLCLTVWTLSEAERFISLGDFENSILIMFSNLSFNWSGDTEFFLILSKSTSSMTAGECESALSGV